MAETVSSVISDSDSTSLLHLSTDFHMGYEGVFTVGSGFMSHAVSVFYQQFGQLQ